MLVNKIVNNDYVHVIQIKIKKDTAILLINDQLALPVTKNTMVRNAEKVENLIIKGCVPESFKDTPVEEKRTQSYSFKFLLLLMAYLKRTSDLRNEGFSPASITQHRITEEMLNAIDLEKLIETFKNKLEIVGKNLPSYFALENIKISKSTLYNLSRIYPNLPAMQWKRTYTPDEIEQWRQFLSNRKYQHHFEKKKTVAI